ncbi:PREDICTED: probable E3 ubiquitin-protein ligase RHG1A [Camelina sativa]|uniref:RING-type E3 ubiquitin transferase n=1 Tax=Camelina sativa TaxID=90675 RepID=A0ABM0UJK4_CAMSA|nr:PREDICTED: probable E3 ubiquitin-protein ligase RHG1A [Camelina sativa]XP_010442097.1 PREDICTED: probable E3 ubiquitin-protein ligase RHG1A [Camelina sativa]
MQGERASLGYLSEALNFEHGSSSSNGVIDHWENIHSLGDNDLQDYMIANSESNASLANSVYREQQDLRRFGHGEASSSGTKDEPASHNESRMETRCFDGRRNEIIDLDPVFGQPSGTNQPVQNVNLNAEYIEIHDDISPYRGRSGFLEAYGPGTRVSQPVRSFEENSLGTGSSVEGRRASCKRKALEGSIGQSSSGGYRDFQLGESSSWTPASSVYRPGNGINISGSLDNGPRGVVSGTVPNFPVSAIGESSSRNVCVRSNPSDQQETVNLAAFSASTVVRRPIPPSQSNLSRLLPGDQHSLDLRPGQSFVFSRSPNAPAVSIPPVSRTMLPPFQWTEGSLAGGTSNSTAPVERNLHLDETRTRSTSGNIQENLMFVPGPELRNLARSQSTRNVTSGNLNIASSLPRTGSTTGVPAPSSNLWTPYQSSPHYQRRSERSELVRRSLLSSLAVDATNQRSGDHPTLRPLTPPAPPDGLVLQPGGDNSQMHNRAYARAGPWFDRQGDSVVGIPHSLRALAAASRGRSRLMVSQMQNVLDVMRRDANNNLRLEDVMLLNQSVLFDGAAGIHDRYRDMRLDVDNMSYEELLALEERIGDVCTGVNEETISNRLKQRKYKSNTKSPQDAEPCCICQEEYTEGEDMGTLECGHEFHSQCIKEWLKQKNLCPICKTTGLNTAKKRRIG